MRTLLTLIVALLLAPPAAGTAVAAAPDSLDVLAGPPSNRFT